MYGQQRKHDCNKVQNTLNQMTHMHPSESSSYLSTGPTYAQSRNLQKDAMYTYLEITYLILFKDDNPLPTSFNRFCAAGFTSGCPNTCQNLRVSSPAADATVYPSGL